MTKVLILMCSYNRNEFVDTVLSSLNNQSIINFEVYLIDNGSENPVSINKNDYKFIINIIRNEKNNGCDFDRMNKIVEENDFDYCIWLGDDDVLSNDFFESTEKIISTYNPDILSTGFHFYDYKRNALVSSIDGGRKHSGSTFQYNGFNAFMHHAAFWGVAPMKSHYRSPQPIHPSTSLFSKRSIVNALKKQPGFLLQPLGDPATLGCYLTGKSFIHIDVPMALIGRHKGNASSNITAGTRSYWHDKKPYIQFSPVKAVSFRNLAVEMILALMHYHGIDYYADIKLNDNFFYHHIKEILQDNPWTDSSQSDLNETIEQYTSFLIYSERRPADKRKEILNEVKISIEKLRSSMREMPASPMPEDGFVIKGGFPGIEEAAQYMTESLRPRPSQ